MIPESCNPFSTFSQVARSGAMALTGIALAMSVASACGPDFPNRYFDAPASQIMAAPEAYFAREVARIAGCETASPRDSGGTTSVTHSDDLEELAKVLSGKGIAGDKLAEVKAKYNELRKGLASMSDEALLAALPAEVPAEFALYLRGVRAYRTGDAAAARAKWEELLALPVAERQHRSVWAAYMLGRSAETPEAATAHFRGVRELAAAGFADSQELAAASWGWEARHYLDDNRLDEAAKLYLRHYQAGAPSALNSLSMVMHNAFRQQGYYDVAHSPIREFAADATVRRLWTAYLLSSGTDRYYWEESHHRAVSQACKQWVRILKASDVRSLDEYQHFAWLAYKGGDLPLAKEWLELAPRGVGAAEWIRAKIALQEGNLPLAAQALEKAITFPDVADDLPVLYAELGRVYLAQDKQTEALAAWLRGQHWEDAAYIAERVLTVDELIDFVDNRLDTITSTGKQGAAKPDSGQPSASADAAVPTRATTAAGATVPTGAAASAGATVLTGAAVPVATAETVVAAGIAAAAGTVVAAGTDQTGVAQAATSQGLAGQSVAAPAPDEALGEAEGRWQEVRGYLRSLLARRLMRENRFETALRYFNAGAQAAAGDYIGLVKSAYDISKPAEQRADDFWQSALLVRSNGMQLFGTELYPDGAIWDGYFPRSNEAELRRNLAKYEQGPLAPTTDELERLKSNKTPDKRFHYRYRAAQLGGWAASLLPNDSEETADILYTSGSWLKARDPLAAEPFYQALVIRCPHTALGQAAASLKWFPPDKESVLAEASASAASVSKGN